MTKWSSLAAAACLTVGAACGSHPTRTTSGTTTTSAGANPPPALDTGTSAPAPTAPSTTATARTAAGALPTTTAQPSGATSATSTRAGQATTTTTAATAAGTVVSSTHNSSYGDILVDAQGRTLYLFTPDDGASSPQCTGSCAQTWPPLKASGTPRAQGGARQSMLGVSAGQVTYNGHPLYLYSGDSQPGQTNGEGVAAVWYVVSTSGDPVLH